jgi:hypothetical protein
MDKDMETDTDTYKGWGKEAGRNTHMDLVMDMDMGTDMDRNLSTDKDWDMNTEMGMDTDTDIGLKRTNRYGACNACAICKNLL